MEGVGIFVFTKTQTMDSNYNITIRKNGSFESAITPDGGSIQNIVKGSIQFEQTIAEKANGYVRMKLEIFVKESNITIKEEGSLS